MGCCLLSAPESMAVSLICDHAVVPSTVRSSSPKNAQAGIPMAMSSGSPQELHFYASMVIKHYAPHTPTVFTEMWTIYLVADHMWCVCENIRGPRGMKSTTVEWVHLVL